MDKKAIIDKLSQIFTLELSGVIRYTHYSLMIVGYNRLPLIDFFKSQASESLDHANLAGEHITGLGGHPPVEIDTIEETHKHNINNILKETLEHEQNAIKIYYELLFSISFCFFLELSICKWSIYSPIINSFCCIII